MSSSSPPPSASSASAAAGQATSSAATTTSNYADKPCVASSIKAYAETVPPLIDKKLVPHATIKYVREYAPRVVTDVMGRFVKKFDESLRYGLGVVGAKIDEFAKVIAQGTNPCDEPLDDDLRRIEIERGRLRLLNSLKRAKPDLLSSLGDMGKQLGDVDPRNVPQARLRWADLVAPYAKEMGLDIDAIKAAAQAEADKRAAAAAAAAAPGADGGGGGGEAGQGEHGEGGGPGKE